MSNPQAKTATEHAAHVADQHPIVELVPSTAATPKPRAPRDRAQGTHSKAGTTKCGAARWLRGSRVSCELKPKHGGEHQDAGRTWRGEGGAA